MGRPCAFPLADVALYGQLDRLLRHWRAEGRTYRAIAAGLRLRGVDVSHETVRRWCLERGITKDAA